MAAAEATLGTIIAARAIVAISSVDGRGWGVGGGIAIASNPPSGFRAGCSTAPLPAGLDVQGDHVAACSSSGVARTRDH